MCVSVRADSVGTLTTPLLPNGAPETPLSGPMDAAPPKPRVRPTGLALRSDYGAVSRPRSTKRRCLHNDRSPDRLGSRLHRGTLTQWRFQAAGPSTRSPTRSDDQYSRSAEICRPSKSKTAISRIRFRTPWTTSSNSASHSAIAVLPSR